jgi:hypothetical protein
MTEITCRACRSAPVACESLCVACLRDRLAADRERRHEQERARIASRRTGRRAPTYRPDPGARNHGHSGEAIE